MKLFFMKKFLVRNFFFFQKKNFSIQNKEYNFPSISLTKRNKNDQKISKNEHVVIAMSGGIDSSVSAYLLKKEGYKVTGIYMYNWEEKEELGYCTGETDYEDALKVSKQLDIPLIRVNFVKEYWNYVFSNFLEEIGKGLTPNPDIMCNKYIKFKCLYEYAINKLGGDYLATGHYARVGWYINPYTKQEEPCLLKGIDKNKDQSYFLCQIEKKVLPKLLFPVGNLRKSLEVKKIAQEINLVNKNKKESFGICFIGKRNFGNFISNYIENKSGKFVDIDTKNIIGCHLGIHSYTIGQRAKISGKPSAFYVCHKDISTNTIYVCRGSKHPSLFKNSLIATNISWISDFFSESLKKFSSISCECQHRYRQKTEKGILIKLPNELDKLKVQFFNSVQSPTPGQIICFYQEDICLGGGIIQSTEPTIDLFINNNIHL